MKVRKARILSGDQNKTKLKSIGTSSINLMYGNFVENVDWRLLGYFKSLLRFIGYWKVIGRKRVL